MTKGLLKSEQGDLRVITKFPIGTPAQPSLEICRLRTKFSSRCGLMDIVLLTESWQSIMRESCCSKSGIVGHWLRNVATNFMALHLILYD